MGTAGNEHCRQIGTLGKMDRGRDAGPRKFILSAHLPHYLLVLLSLSVFKLIICISFATIFLLILSPISFIRPNISTVHAISLILHSSLVSSSQFSVVSLIISTSPMAVSI